jgi:hypothetical protein
MKKLIPLLLLSVVATAHASITATFLDDDGKPLAGARVRLFAREDQRMLRARWLSDKPESAPLASATTGEDGKATLDAKGNTVVRLVADAASRAALAIDVIDGEDAGAFTLPLAAPRKGHLAGVGKPVAGARIIAGPWLIVKSDAQGNFEVPPLISGFERLYFIHPDYVIAENSLITMNDPTRRSIDITMSRGVPIKGRVLAGDDAPVTHASVSVAGWPLAQSGDDGTFAIAHAPANWRVIFASTTSDAGLAMNKRSASIDVKLAHAVSLTGIVKSANAVVPGAFVALYNEIDANHQPSRVTDDKGRFTFDGLVPGHYAIMGTHPGFTIARASIDVPSRPGAVIAAEPLVRVHGRVIDEERKAVSGATVGVLPQPGMSGFLPPQRIATSPNGEFFARAHDASQVQFIAARRGYAAGIAGPVTIDRAKEIVITLPKGFPLQLHVVDTQRAPVAGANVDISRAAEGAGIRSSLPCAAPREDCRLTKSDGTFETRLVEGKYDLLISGDDIAPKRVSGQQLTARSSPFTVTIDRGVEVSGNVVMADGSPAAGAMVNVRTTIARNVAAGADGSFTLRGLPAGPLSLTATMPQTTPQMQSLPVAVTAPAKNVQIRIPATATISGRVIDKATSQPIADFQITVTQTDMMGSGGVASVPMQFHNEDGSFTLESLPGRVDVRAVATGYVRAALSGITIEEGKPMSGLELKLDRGARVVGHVTAGGQPLAGAFAGVSSDHFSTLGSANATTDANGDYTLDGIAAGEREVDVRKQGYVPKRKSVTAAAGSDARADVELERGADLRGRVVDAGGRPVEGARLQVRAGAGMTSPTSTNGRAVSDSEGNFKVEGLAEGRYNVMAEREGYVSGMSNDVEPSTPNLIITLERGGTITGHVTGLAPGELAGMTVTASSGRSSARANVDSDGSFTVNGVPDGVAMVSAARFMPPMRHSSSKRVTVTNGSASPVEIDFAEGATVRGRVTRDGHPLTNGFIAFSPTKAVGEGESNSPIAPDGTYQVSGLVNADYRVFINLPGPYGSAYNDTLTVNGSMTHDFELRGATLRGRVIDAASSAPLADATLTLDPVKTEIRTMRRATTDSEGNFFIELLPEGTYNLVVQRQQYASKQLPVNVAGGSVPDAEVRLEAVQPTIARIVDATTGSPVTANLFVTDLQTKTNVGGNWTRGDDGTMKLWLSPGRYTLHVNANEYSSQDIDVTVPGPEVRVALQKGSSISFHLSDNTTHRVRFIAEGKVVKTDYITSPYRTTLTGLVPGTYVVEVTDATGKVPQGSYPVTLAAGQVAVVEVR